jgi:anthranilate synthase component 1
MSEIQVVTEKEQFIETASPAPPEARVPVEVRVSVEDPFTAYRRARKADTDGIYLETTGEQSGWGYFTVNPIERIQVSADAVSIGDGSPAIQAIDSLLHRESLVRGECDIPYPCGAFGWLSYDVARELETLPDTTQSDNFPRLQLGVFDCVAAWREPSSDDDTPENGPTVADTDGDVSLHITACPIIGDVPKDAYEKGRTKAIAFAETALSGEQSVPSSDGVDRMAFESDCGEAAFAERVQTVKQRIRDGDTFQTNVSHRLTAPAVISPVRLFAAVRRVNPAPYSGLVEYADVDLVSASPELLLEVDGDQLATEPIAGTRPRGETPEEESKLETELLSDEKERAEHAMLVDLERNDLGKVCEYGSVDVSEYRRVDRYSEVMHLVSLIQGTRRDSASVADAIAAAFPGGTITGAPKPRTMEIIDEVEKTRRGPYTGSIGILGFDDRATLNIIIRTLVRRDGTYRLRVGAGIVQDSLPEEEYQETMDKARALIVAVDEALGEQADLLVEQDAFDRKEIPNESHPNQSEDTS